MGEPRRVDAGAARARLDEALHSHEQVFEQFFLARLLGLRFAYLPAGAADRDKEVCRIEFEVSEMLANPQGSLHGGIMATVMDISVGHLINKVQGPGATIEMKIQHLRPVGFGTARCEGRFLRRGRTVSFLESRLFGPEDKLAAFATATWKMPQAQPPPP